MRTSKKQAARERERAGETSSLTGVGGESIGECDHHDDDESVAVAVALSVELLPPSPPPRDDDDVAYAGVVVDAGSVVITEHPGGAIEERPGPARAIARR